MAKPDPTDRMLDELLKGKRPEEILGSEGVLRDLTKRLVERALQGEMTAHLGYEKHASEGRDGGNSRNGSSSKRVRWRQLAQRVVLEARQGGLRRG